MNTPHNGKHIDKIQIKTKHTKVLETITQIENYYFDITQCFVNETQKANFFNEEKTWKKIKKRIIELESENDFNKECIELLKKEQLFNDSKLSITFLKVILNDHSMPLFESMMNNKRIPIMSVLRIIGKELNNNQN